MNTASAPTYQRVSQQTLDSFIVASLLVVGLFVPSSFGNERLFAGPSYLASCSLLSLLVLRRERLPSLPLALSLLAALPLLVLFTVTTGFNTGTFGELAQFAALALLYMTTLKEIRSPRWLSHLFLAVNVTNIALGVAILAGSEWVKNILVSYYSQFYAELVPAMLLLRKPVLTFGTHSVAGFFFYVFFYVNWQTYRIRRSKISLFFALSYLALTLALLSVTGLLLSIAGLMQVTYHLWHSLKHRLFWTACLLIVMATAAVVQWNVVQPATAKLLAGGKDILTSPGNGLLGRLTPTGTMYGVMRYVTEHPFKPVGLSRRDELLIADMGFLDYLIRGSVILVVWVYGGLFLFLKRNVLARSDRFFLFVAILAFEVGFSVLLYTRTPFLLAFFVIYLNGLRRSSPGLPGAGHIWT